MGVMLLWIIIIIFIIIFIVGSNLKKATKNENRQAQPQPNRPVPQPQNRTQQLNRTQPQSRLQKAQMNSQRSVGQGKQPDIVEHAKANNARFNEDTTLKDIESMHGHSEAEHKVSIEHSRNCQTLGKDNDNSVEAESQSIFGSVEDLIAMGYSGNLEFERDFLGEGLDMISNFQL